MKKISTPIKAALAALLLSGCAFIDQGEMVNREQNELERLERKREDYESRYVMVLNNLERNTGDPKMERERDMVRKKILDLNTQITAQREIYERSVQDWEKKLLEEKLQKEIFEREERSLPPNP